MKRIMSAFSAAVRARAQRSVDPAAMHAGVERARDVIDADDPIPYRLTDSAVEATAAEYTRRAREAHRIDRWSMTAAKFGDHDPWGADDYALLAQILGGQR